MIERRFLPVVVKLQPKQWASLEVFDQRIVLTVEDDGEGQTWLSFMGQLGIDRFVTFTVWIDVRRMTGR